MARAFPQKLLDELGPEQTMALFLLRSGARHRHPPYSVRDLAAQVSRRFADQGEQLAWLLQVAAGEILPTSAADVARLREGLDLVIAAMRGR
jgi:hypothetical protein